MEFIFSTISSFQHDIKELFFFYFDWLSNTNSIFYLANSCTFLIFFPEIHSVNGNICEFSNLYSLSVVSQSVWCAKDHLNHWTVDWKRYGICSITMLIALCAKNKLGATSSDLLIWERCNAIVLSWIMIVYQRRFSVESYIALMQQLCGMTLKNDSKKWMDLHIFTSSRDWTIKSRYQLFLYLLF